MLNGKPEYSTKKIAPLGEKWVRALEVGEGGNQLLNFHLLAWVWVWVFKGSPKS